MGNNKTENVIELRLNGAPLCYMNTRNAVSADYLAFMDAVLNALSLDKASLQHEANLNGKTINHQFTTFGAITDPKDHQ
ncbi:hypothetical protein [Arsenophonus nasoniae]|uniref:Uncharacterized protein n=1 Tax=Arsenophonus nasoniae TaxID=638 RepID=A0AA95GCP1_9GAMM|nr:hypothetical protein [Arsenophonus nasoniae]WGL96267.1 hypothetical protein QE207_06775 [Arsenophonus nasoniae]